MKRILALLLVALMAVSMLSALADEPRNITLAVWWDMYYDSDDESWEANPGATGKETDIMRFENVKTIEDTVADGGKVSLIGFGTFESKERKARTSRNPRTGEAVQVAASTAPAFKAGKEFKDKVAYLKKKNQLKPEDEAKLVRFIGEL